MLAAPLKQGVGTVLGELSQAYEDSRKMSLVDEGRSLPIFVTIATDYVLEYLFQKSYILMP